MTFKYCLFILLLFFSLAAEAKVKVIVTLPDFIEIVKDIGGDQVEVESFLDGTEDPHFVDAVPSFITQAARADVVCAVGLELEVGWLPKVLSKSGNAKVQPGGQGFCELGRGVDVLEKSSGQVDRSMGDVHAGGNPHFNLSPTKLIEGSKEVLRVLKKVSVENAQLFDVNAKKFEAKMSALRAEIATMLQPINAKRFIQFHKEFTYFFNEYDLTSYGAIEEKPGVPPSSARIAQVSTEAKIQGVVLALGAFHTPKRHLEKFTEISGIPHIKIPGGVQRNNKNLNSIEKVQNHIANELLKNREGASR